MHSGELLAKTIPRIAFFFVVIGIAAANGFPGKDSGADAAPAFLVAFCVVPVILACWRAGVLRVVFAYSVYFAVIAVPIVMMLCSAIVVLRLAGM